MKEGGDGRWGRRQGPGVGKDGVLVWVWKDVGVASLNTWEERGV